MNPKAIESKWQKKWTEAKAYESEPGGDKEKYFVNCPYPYMNGYLHLGHAFTYLRRQLQGQSGLRGRRSVNCKGTTLHFTDLSKGTTLPFTDLEQGK